jgi:DNA-binding response OmpR family regulator
MGRDPNPRPVRILYIGQPDPAHEKLWEQLPREGITVEFARTQNAGLDLATNLQPQVVVINLVDARFSGKHLCHTLSRRVSSARCLVIVDRYGGAGHVPCEQRLVRPFTIHKLRDALFKLLEEVGPHMITAGCLQLNVVARIVTCPKGQQQLSPKQCDLLTIFMQHPNQVISRKDLMGRIWETAYMGDTRTLDVHIRWLREKIELDPTRPSLLVTCRGVGYVLTE